MTSFRLFLTYERPSKHHYIPAFYLRQRAATNCFLCEMRKIRGKVVVRSKIPDGTGFQKYFYKIDVSQPTSASTSNDISCI